MHWHRRRSWFYFEGSLGGLCFNARIGVFELNAGVASATQLVLDAAGGKQCRGLALEVWESEGGALPGIPTEEVGCQDSILIHA